MIVSRRGYLLAKPSERIMRAAAHAASPQAIHNLARKQAEKQHAELMAVVNGR